MIKAEDGNLFDILKYSKKLILPEPHTRNHNAPNEYSRLRWRIVNIANSVRQTEIQVTQVLLCHCRIKR